MASPVVLAFSSVLKRLYPNSKLAPCTMLRVAGFLPVTIVLAIQGLAYSTAVFGTLIPLYKRFHIAASLLLIAFHFIFINVIINYLLLVFLDPGSPPEQWRASPSSEANRRRGRKMDDEEKDNLLPPPLRSKVPVLHFMKERTYDGQLRYCRFCHSYKPDRTHHCSACRRCVLRMDHHCIFVNNCISFYNHKFFISFVTYAFLGCATIAIITLPTFLHILSVPPGTVAKFRLARYTGQSSFYLLNSVRLSMKSFSVADQLTEAMKTITLIGYVTTTAFTLALSVFVGLHFYLTAKGRTTIEMYEVMDPTRAPIVTDYDLGIARNFKAICGSRVLFWFFPTRAYIAGDGLSFARQSDDDNVV